MKRSSRIIAAVLSLMCIAGLSACGGGNAEVSSAVTEITGSAGSSETSETAETPETPETPENTEAELADENGGTENMSEQNTEKLQDLKIVYFTNFEDGDISAFSNRGEDDTSVLSVSEEFAAGGSKSLSASGRTETWNGPAFRLDGICEPDREYLINASAMQRDNSPVTMSFQYTDEGGEVHYSNLDVESGSDWLSFRQIKVGFTPEMTEVYVYFEGGTSDIFIDNFNISELPSAKIENDLPSLSEIFADDFKVGTALTPSDLSAKGVMALTEKHFGGSLTAGNEMKPDFVLDHKATLAYVGETGDDESPQISFDAAKPLLEYCRNNNVPMRIHTLVWHSQTPAWFFKEGFDPDGEWVSKEKMSRRMENYIRTYFETLTSLYPDIDFYACDVVNEAWLEDGGPRKPGENKMGDGTSAWVKVYGDNSFIEDAFTYARKYAPEGCKLYYNDYNEYMDKKMNAITEMALDLKEKGIIDGIGMQSHLDVRKGADAFPSAAMYSKALDNYAELGLDIQVTELDATVPAGTGDKYFEAQAEYYKGIVDAVCAHKDNVSALIFWGVTDDRSWRNSQQPLLFDRTYTAKPAFYSIIEEHLSEQ